MTETRFAAGCDVVIVEVEGEKLTERAATKDLQVQLHALSRGRPIPHTATEEEDAGGQLRPVSCPTESENNSPGRPTSGPVTVAMQNELPTMGER